MARFQNIYNTCARVGRFIIFNVMRSLFSHLPLPAQIPLLNRFHSRRRVFKREVSFHLRVRMCARAGVGSVGGVRMRAGGGFSKHETETRRNYLSRLTYANSLTNLSTSAPDKYTTITCNMLTITHHSSPS